MNDEENKLETLFNHLTGKIVEEAFIENDSFVFYFDDGSMVELYSDNGDLDLYFEINKDNPIIH